MNILHVSTARTWRGGEQQIVNLYKGLNQYQTAIKQQIVCAKNSAMHQYCQQHALSHTPLVKGFTFNLFFAHQLQRLCRQNQVDIIHCHDPHAHQFAVLSADFFGNHTPIVLSRRVDFAIHNNAYSRYKYRHTQIRKIICVSHAIERIMSSCIEDKKRLCTIHSGIDFGRFDQAANLSHTRLRQSYQLADNTLLIGNVAALADHKDYFTFIDTAQILLQSGLNATFFIIGEGEQNQQLQQYALKKGVADKVIFTGFRNDIAQILPELSIFLITSKTEGLGTAVADAMYCRVPVVATAAGGIPELVKHEQTGYIAPIQSPQQLADRILHLLQQPKDVVQTMVQQAYQQVIDHFSLQSMAQKTAAVYGEVIKQEKNSE